MLNLDFSTVKSSNVVLEEGMYNVTIDKIEEKVSSTGKPMLCVIFKEEASGASIFENYVLTPDALWKLKELLIAAGIDCDSDVSFEPEELIGMMFKAKVIQREYNDNKLNSIKKIFAA